ncbi:MAG: hypothetical protein HXO61_07900 [Rothia mucilaginosa]|uniref:Uncharacterized protein n=1 Tax=Rothia mucilaginosa TaxID=43675 RepID=A0A930L2R9_9MICC|nr:hypothetical protein [Rothia mucilaginosa]MBF1657834.1 hypothetical protein [Rothia mucilaginosa]
MTLNWFPLPKNTGSISARGASRTLGRPNLSPLALVTREMAQNSWDARLEGRMPEFGCLVRYANQGVLNTLRNDVFAAGFEIHSKYTGLDQTFNRGDVYFLEFWDRGTVGLDGPDRPDEAVEEGESQNFVNLTMNLGSDNKGQGNGGSYGFGKTAAFNMSESQSVIYWSAFKTKTGEIDYRLIAVALGKEYTYDGRNYTGRHWWGYEGPTVKGTGNILPLTGERARLLGKEIFSRHFNDGETGTSILIVDAKPAELMEVSDDEGKIPDEPDQIIDRSHEKIQNIVMYHLWPKLDVEDGNRSMDIRINNNPVLIQNLKNKPEYKGIEQLCSALIDVRKMSEHKNIDFESFDGVFRYKGYIFKRTRDSYNIGYLKIVLGAYDSTAERSIYPQNTVCLMRNEAELVVQYRKVNDLDDSKATWYGVFKPDLETDVAFREAEPPAHDEWNPSSLENAKHKNIVVYAASNITKSLKSLFESKDTKRDSGSLGSLSKISQKLARFNPIMSTGGGVNTELIDEDEGKNKKRPGGVVRRASVSIESAAMTGVHPQNPDYVQYFISFSCSSAWKVGQRIGIKVSIATGDERTLEYTDSHDLEPSWSEGWGPDANDTQRAGHVYVQWDGPDDSEENQGSVVITLRKGKTYIFEVEG